MEQFEHLLWRRDDERDACGVGFVANANGTRSHRIVTMALECVANLTHRGAVAADAKSGDGAGVLTQIPYALFRPELESRGVHLSDDRDLAVGMFFLPGSDPARAERCRQMIEQIAGQYGIAFFGWRPVPVQSAALGEHAARTQ
ncbi:MAG TPA: hypothetical protein VNJ09_01510, partial [Chthonomonadales bacterium]|nr:hypothetical protein [Chthonomonadales bacterium]